MMKKEENLMKEFIYNITTYSHRRGTTIKCTNCDFHGSIRTDDNLSLHLYRPISGVYKSKIEYRLCYDCNEIQLVWLGIGGEHCLLDIEPYLNEEYLLLNSNTILSRINQIVLLKKSNFLKYLFKIFELRMLRNKFNLCSEKDKEAKKYYERCLTKPRCLECSSTNVSGDISSNIRHECGGYLYKSGNFVSKPNPYRGSDSIVLELCFYDEHGNFQWRKI